MHLHKASVLDQHCRYQPVSVSDRKGDRWCRTSLLFRDVSFHFPWWGDLCVCVLFTPMWIFIILHFWAPPLLSLEAELSLWLFHLVPVDPPLVALYIGKAPVGGGVAVQDLANDVDFSVDVAMEGTWFVVSSVGNRCFRRSLSWERGGALEASTSAGTQSVTAWHFETKWF